MAITKIHAITATVDKSIAYICNPDKTCNQRLLYFHDCGRETAAFDFDFALSKTNRDNKNLAYHLIQSFKPGTVTEEEANAMAKELAYSILGDKYSYVIATHNDKNHIHNHIIFCAADNIDHKKYHDCRETYRTIRRENDRICKEHNLEIIPEQDASGKRRSYTRKSGTYKEWQSRNDGTSWKYKLKKDIEATIKISANYDIFIRKMREQGYEIKNVYDEGKYLSFKAPGQQRWIRGRASTLGAEYTRESIMAAISGKAYEHTSKSDIKIVKNMDNTGKVLKMIDTSSEEFQQRVGLKIWAEKENLKRMAHNYTLMVNAGYRSMESLKKAIDDCGNGITDMYGDIAHIQREKESISSIIKDAEQYVEYKKYDDAYKKAKNKESVLQKYEMEIILFGGAKNGLKEHGVSLKEVNKDFVEEQRKLYYEKGHEISAIYNEIEAKEKEEKKLQELYEQLKKELHLEEQEKVKEKTREKKKKRQQCL